MDKIKPFETQHLVAKIHSLLNIRSKEMIRLRELQTSKGLNALLVELALIDSLSTL